MADRKKGSSDGEIDDIKETRDEQNVGNRSERTGPKVVFEENEGIANVYASITKDKTIKADQIATVINATQVGGFIPVANEGIKVELFTTNWSESLLGEVEGLVTPFTVLSEVPSIFEIRSVHNLNQNPNEKVGVLETGYKILDFVKKSADLFNSTTLTARNYLKREINGIKIYEPNDYSSGVLKIVTLQGGYLSGQKYVHGLESRLYAMISIFRAFDGKLFDFPKKLVGQIDNTTALRSMLSEMTVYDNCNPHIYFSVFRSINEWYNEQISNLASRAPIEIGDQDMTIVGAMKQSAIVKIVTDQFAASLAWISFNRFKARQVDGMTLTNRYRANMLEDTQVSLKLNEQLTFLNMYQPSVDEARSYMYYLTVSKDERSRVVSFLMNQIRSLAQFDVLETEDVIAWAGFETSQKSAKAQNYARNVLAAGQTSDFEQMLIMETFSSWFDFNFSFGDISSDHTATMALFGVLMYARTFPSIFRKGITSLGYIAMMSFASLFPQEWATFVKYNGYFVDRDGDRSGESFNKISKDEAIRGVRYSIFADTIIGKSELTKLIASFRDLCKPQYENIFLQRKKLAGYPYMRSDYATTLSWPRITTDNALTQTETRWTEGLVMVTGWVARCVDLRYGKGSAASVASTPKNFMRSFLSRCAENFRTASSTYQVTAARLQETLKESFAYVYDENKVAGDSHFEYPAPLVMGTLDQQQRMDIHSLEVNNMSIYAALRFALTTNGIGVRNISVSPHNPQGNAGVPKPIRAIGFIEGHVWDNFYLSALLRARNLALALWILRCIRIESEDNPLKELQKHFKKILAVCTWIPMAKHIFSLFNLNWEEYFTNSTGLRGYDTRALSRALYRIDRVDFSPSSEKEVGELIGVDICLEDQYVKESFRILSDMFFVGPGTGAASPIIPISKGLYIGRFFVDDMELKPKRMKGWKPVKKGQWEISRETSDDVDVIGLRPVLRIRDNEGALIGKYVLPHIKENVQIMLGCDWIADIPIEFRREVAVAILDGRIALRVSKQVISAKSIYDAPDRVSDYSEQMDVEKMLSILRTPQHDIIEHDFVNTAYAVNFSTNVDIKPMYKQWVIPSNLIDTSLHAALITYGAPVSKTRLPDVEEVEFGRLVAGPTMLTSKAVVKTQLGKVNWNNAYPVINKSAVVETVEATYTAANQFISDALSE